MKNVDGWEGVKGRWRAFTHLKELGLKKIANESGAEVGSGGESTGEREVHRNSPQAREGTGVVDSNRQSRHAKELRRKVVKLRYKVGKGTSSD